MDDYRKGILKMIESREPKTNLKEASLAIGRNHSYLHQFIYKATPQYLSETVRLKLAAHLQVPEKTLLSPEQIDTFSSAAATASTLNGVYTLIPVYDVCASAGDGKLIEESTVLHQMSFRTEWLKRVTNASPADLAVISVSGDSMEPTLSGDDTVLVDMTKRALREDGIYALNYDGLLLVKRVRIDPIRKVAQIISDNPAYSPVENVRPDQLVVFGKVVWLGRRI